MKADFIPKFIEGLCEFGIHFVQAFNRESWHYKDLRMGGYDPDKIYQGVQNLRHRGFVRSLNDGRYRFTKKGVDWFECKVPLAMRYRHQKWDGKWRVVIFDIPHEFRGARDRLRQRLRLLGFLPLQKSVMACPYPCAEELSEICGRLKISDYVDILTADSVGFREEEFKKFFGL